MFLRNGLLFSPHWKRSLLIACELQRCQQEEARSVRPVTFKAVRRTHSAMERLLSLYAEVTEKMRGYEEVDVLATVWDMPHKAALRYLQACRRWMTENTPAGKSARTLKDIRDESRTFPN